MAFTVSAAVTNFSTFASLKVFACTGVTEAGGASSGFTGSSAPTAALTPAGSGSLILEGLGEFSGTWVSFTAQASNTLSDNAASAGGEGYADGRYAGTVTAGTPVTLGASAPAGKWCTMAAYELLASGTPAIDGTSPAAATATSSPVTTASFTPPSGAVLAAVLSFNTTAASVITISDTSGLGLTWTARATYINGSFEGTTAIYTATVPATGATVTMGSALAVTAAFPAPSYPFATVFMGSALAVTTAIPAPAVTAGPPYITAVTASSSSQAGYFTDATGAPRLWVCAQPWGLPSNAGRWSGGLGGTWQQDMDNFITTRAAQGCTAILVYPIGNLANGTAFDNGNTWDNIAPFNTGQDPASGFNNTFWARIDYLLASALSKGMYSLINIDLVYNTGTGNCFSGWGTTQYQAFGAALGGRYKNQPGLEWCFGEDGVPGGYDTFYNSILTGLSGAGDTHWVSAMWAAEYTSRYETDNNASSAWGTAHSAYNFVYTYNCGYFCIEYAYGEVASEGASSLLPVVWGNGYYYGGSSAGIYDSLADRAYRQEIWWTLASGTRGFCAESHERLWSSSAPGAAATQWFFVNSLKNITTAFTSWPQWYHLLPDRSSAFVTAGRGTRVTGLVAGGSGTPYEPAFANSYVAASITPDKTLAVCYLPNSTTITANTAVLAQDWAASWADPITGALSPAGAGPTFNSTAKGANSQGDPDWVLVFKTAASTAQAYAASYNTGVPGGAGGWVNPVNAEGAPDSTYATWAAP